MGEQDSQKCERKVIEFEGRLEIVLMLEGRHPSGVACRLGGFLEVFQPESGTEDRRGRKTHKPKQGHKL